jgi:hypothetical protein
MLPVSFSKINPSVNRAGEGAGGSWVKLKVAGFGGRGKCHEIRAKGGGGGQKVKGNVKKSKKTSDKHR